MNKRFILLIIGILILSDFSLLAQRGKLADVLTPVEQKSKMYMGPVLGFNKSMHTVELKTFAQDPLCPTFIDGSNNGFYAGWSFEYLLGDAEVSNSSIIARLLYNKLPSSFEQTDLEVPIRVIEYNGNVPNEVNVISSVLHTNEVKYDVISFDVMYKLNPFQGKGMNGFGVSAGFTFDYAMTKTQEQRMDLLRPLNAQFVRDENAIAKGYKYEKNDRSIVIMEGDIPNSSAFRLGVKAGIQYEILLGTGGMWVAPGIFYNFGITNLSSDFNWRVNALQIGVDLRFSTAGILGIF